MTSDKGLVSECSVMRVVVPRSADVISSKKSADTAQLLLQAMHIKKFEMKPTHSDARGLRAMQWNSVRFSRSEKN